MPCAGLLLWPCLRFSSPTVFFLPPQASFSSPTAKRTTEWEGNNVARARTGTRAGRRDGQRYPEEETRAVPGVKESGIKASLRVSLKGAL